MIDLRMWMVDPSKMCRKHLLGEHVECHMFYGTLLKKKNIDGYIRNNCLEVTALKSRHDLLAQEMTRREYQHNSPMETIPDISYLDKKVIDFRVNCEESESDLRLRCKDCFR